MMAICSRFGKEPGYSLIEFLKLFQRDFPIAMTRNSVVLTLRDGISPKVNGDRRQYFAKALLSRPKWHLRGLGKTAKLVIVECSLSCRGTHTGHIQRLEPYLQGVTSQQQSRREPALEKCAYGIFAALGSQVGGSDLAEQLVDENMGAEPHRCVFFHPRSGGNTDGRVKVLVAFFYIADRFHSLGGHSAKPSIQARARCHIMALRYK